MEERFRKFVEEQKLVAQSEKVLLAVSGGPDSMAMLHLFRGLQQPLEVVHLNHRIRGKEADDDAAFVEKECRKLGIPFRGFTFDVPRFALRKKLSLEEAGRRIRRHFFSRYANLKKIDAIALAHTSDDQAETIFMNFLRGAGPRGLAGIFPKQGRFIHPMLCFSKSEILDYLKQNEIPYRLDGSNEELHYFRNRIRKEIFPYLETKIGYDPKNGLLRLGKIFQDEEEWIGAIVEPIFKARFRAMGDSPKNRDRHQFHELRIEANEFPSALLRRLIRKFIETSVGHLKSISMAQIESVLELLGRETGKRFLAPGFLIEKTRNGLLLANQVRLNENAARK